MYRKAGAVARAVVIRAVMSKSIAWPARGNAGESGEKSGNR